MPLVCAYYLADDWRTGRRRKRGDIATDSGRRHAGRDLEASLEYIEHVYRDYLAYGAIERFSGVVCEIGPGDNLGVALLALGGGASRVIALDRFHARRDARAQRRIYGALVDRHGLEHLFAGEPAEDTVRHIEVRSGEPAETFFRDAGLVFDHVISRAVLEHLTDPIGALDDMVAALAPGGGLIHRIDLRDHAMFAGHHPLTFLTVPEGVYRRMVRASGRPNRVLLPRYRAWLERSGLQGALRITRLAGVEEELGPAAWDEIAPAPREKALRSVEAIRGRLAAPFRDLDGRDLAVSGCVLTVRKEGAGA